MPRHIEIFRGWLGQREVTPNRSPLIDRINRHAKNPLGAPYCAAAWGLALDSAHAATPAYRGGLAVRYSTPSSITAADVLRGTATLQPGDLGIFRKGRTIFGHLVAVESVIDRRTIITLEANTSAGRRGSQRDGDGFYRRTRTIQPYSYFRLTHFTRPTYDGKHTSGTRPTVGRNRHSGSAGGLMAAGMLGVFAVGTARRPRDRIGHSGADGGA